MHEFLIDSQVFCPTWIDETNLWIIFSQEKYRNENSLESLCWALEITTKKGLKSVISKLLQISKWAQPYNRKAQLTIDVLDS